VLARPAAHAGGRERHRRHLAHVRNELDRLHLVTLATADGQVAQRSATTAGHKTILAALELPEPARFFDFTIPTD